MAASTQDNIPLSGIKDGIVLLKDGSYRLILEVAALNYDLKSEEEQNSLIFRYQGFINSLHFPIQIVVQSKKLDLTPYINKIKKLAVSQKNELIKIQTEDYVDFVEKLINLANIMKKSFYVVIGYQPLNVGQGSWLDKLLGHQEQAKLRISLDEFTHHSKELLQRGQTVASGLGSMGLHCRQLETEEIIELFYGLYNPEIAGKERLEDATNLSSSLVSETSGKPEDNVQDTVSDSGIAKIDNMNVVKEQAKIVQDEKAVKEVQAQDASVAQEKQAKDTVETLNQVTSDPAKGTPSLTSPEAGQKVGSNGFDKAPTEVSSSSVMVDQQEKQAAPAQQIGSSSPTSATSGTEVPDEIKDPKLNKNFGW